MYVCILSRGKGNHSGESGSLEINLSRKVKIADSVLLNLFMRDNEKCKISHLISSKHLKHWSHLYGRINLAVTSIDRHTAINTRCYDYS